MQKDKKALLTVLILKQEWADKNRMKNTHNYLPNDTCVLLTPK